MAKRESKFGREVVEPAIRRLIEDEDGSSGGIRSPGDLGARIGLEYDALWDRLSNRTLFSPEEIRALLGELGDPQIANWLLHESDMIAVKQVGGPARKSGTEKYDEFKDHAHRITMEFGGLVATATKAIGDGRLSRQEEVELKVLVQNTEMAVAAMRVFLEPIKEKTKTKPKRPAPEKT